MAKWPTVSNFFYNSFMREKKNPKKNYKIQNPKNIIKTPVGEEKKKLKIPKKLQNIKSKNIVELLLERCIFFHA